MTALRADEKILVIRHGALGDFVLSMGPFKAIRDHHADAHVTLLTTPPFVDFARASGYFDEIWTDARPSIFRVKAWLELRRRFRGGGFTRVYDLQTSTRSSLYFHFFAKGAEPEWSGIATGCSHPHDDPQRNRLHTLDRQRAQLARAGVENVPPPDLGWVRSDISRFDLPDAYFLLVPGGSAHRPAKRWPADRYAALARRLAAERNWTPVLLGGPDEAALAAEIKSAAPASMDLAGKTGFADIVVMARGAHGAVGNDTGPIHLIAPTGCQVVVLFSRESDPGRSAPRGEDVTVLRRDDLTELSVDEVAEAAGLRAGGAPDST